MKKALLCVLALLLGCEQEEKFVCRIGEHTGLWRVTYQRLDGTCGNIPAETVNLTPGGSGFSQNECKTNFSYLSEDRCRHEIDLTCPTEDRYGSIQLAGVIRQVAEDRMEANVTITVDHPYDLCRGTYLLVYQRLLKNKIGVLEGARKETSFLATFFGSPRLGG